LNRKADADNESRTLDGILSHEFGFITDAAEVRRLESLVTRLQMLSPRPDVPIAVRIVDDTGHPPNIAAATSTTIYFWKSYLDRHPSDSELLFIAGHELAHVQLGHYAETLIGKETDRQRLLKDLGAEAAQSIGWRTEEILHKLRTAPWERQQEEAADLLGTQQALEAGALPQGIHEALSRMHQDEQLRARPLPPDIQGYRDSLRDHPKPLDRLKALEQAFGEKFWEQTSLKMPLACHRK
jgi:predicted Zn-dependent protease